MVTSEQSNQTINVAVECRQSLLRMAHGKCLVSGTEARKDLAPVFRDPSVAKRSCDTTGRR